MNLLTGKIEEVYVENGAPMAKVRVQGAFMRVPLLFVQEARAGDSILISSGVAISRIDDQSEKENDHVSGNPGESA